MTTLLMLHNSKETALVWRRVADSLPQLWGVVAPDLHSTLKTALQEQKPEQIAKAMQTAVERDLATLGITEPIVLVAAGDAAVTALNFAAHNPQRVRAIFLSEPVFRVSSGQIRLAKMKANFSGRRKKRTISDPSQELNYLRALASFASRSSVKIDSPDSVLREIPMRILVAEKERSIARKVQALAEHCKQVEYFLIHSAESGWNDYAPAQYAANIAEFVEQLERA